MIINANSNELIETSDEHEVLVSYRIGDEQDHDLSRTENAFLTSR
jgi:hypothetical protein